MKTHICLVSAQAAANLLPALDPELKPEKVVLVVSGPMRNQAENLAKVLKQNGIAVNTQHLSNEHHFNTTEGELCELADSLSGDDVTLNITGGTKLMSVAAQSVASACGWRMFYVDVDTDQAIWLGRDQPAPQPLKEQLRLRHYLQGYGFAFADAPGRPQPNAAQQTLMSELTLQIGTFEPPLSQLNWLAQQSEDRKQLSVIMNAQQQDSRSLESLTLKFANAGALTVQGNTIHFSSKEHRDFVKGGWLELLVFHEVEKLRTTLGIRDCAANLAVTDNGDVKNELDVAFMARNRLFVIECKTARMDKPESSKANDTLFKLAGNCRRIGGLGTRGMLVSYRALDEAEKRLAGALNIALVCGAEIQRLQEKLKVWVQPQTR